jgi:hypothetical protein
MDTFSTKRPPTAREAPQAELPTNEPCHKGCSRGEAIRRIQSGASFKRRLALTPQEVRISETANELCCYFRSEAWLPRRAAKEASCRRAPRVQQRRRGLRPQGAHPTPGVRPAIGRDWKGPAPTARQWGPVAYRLCAAGSVLWLPIQGPPTRDSLCRHAMSTQHWEACDPAARCRAAGRAPEAGIACTTIRLQCPRHDGPLSDPPQAQTSRNAARPTAPTTRSLDMEP